MILTHENLDFYWKANKEFKTVQRHFDRFDNLQVLNIMEDGFSYIYTFSQPFDTSYFDVYFFWDYKDSSTNETYGVYIPSTFCSTQYFSTEVLLRLQNFDLGSGLICPELSVLNTQIKMIGDSFGAYYSRLSSQVLYCQLYDYCKSLSEMQTYLDNMLIRYITTNTYFDYLIDDHVGYYIWYSEQLIYHPGQYNVAELRVLPSLIYFLNGSTSMVYETKSNYVTSYNADYNSIVMLFLSVVIDPHFFIHLEYTNYQPVFTNSSRQLDSSQVRILMSFSS